MFEIGDKIVYPMHGAGTIENIELKEILGEKRKYFIMKMPIGEMKVMIPIDNMQEVGVREIISKEEMEEVITILKGDKGKMPQNWNRRFRLNMDKIKSGDIYEIAAVVRNLMLLDKEKGLSTGERKMLNDAKQMLISEMVLVCELTLEETEELVAESVEFNADLDDGDLEEIEELKEEVLEKE
ncbi:CarD family transcriptional regulator [Tissierella creatinophila]|uniref:RNA polymerase-binding transcription factor CarD n=1 Tax=Tissierella creatinophila DSM 6911 TaxID=1123403 RepID=A0A1U7M4E9_TISCR|nr:CarD family transcriptional regulator [Tissierella creatinophila]OLS02171.1 RNA polymerase-binding transcription factor CarD [Tissierella creatinophila DSM 6911]